MELEFTLTRSPSPMDVPPVVITTSASSRPFFMAASWAPVLQGRGERNKRSAYAVNDFPGA